MKPVIAAVTAAAALSACVGSFDISDAALPAATMPEVCQSLAAARANGNQDNAARMLSEIERRGAFSTRELRNIAAAKAEPGMSEYAGLCAWGYYWYDRNTTATAGGTTTQYVIGDGTYNPRRYLYTRNGKVTAVQE